VRARQTPWPRSCARWRATSASTTRSARWPFVSARPDRVVTLQQLLPIEHRLELRDLGAQFVERLPLDFDLSALAQAAARSGRSVLARFPHQSVDERLHAVDQRSK